jgi:arylsulfatase A-like enzyme
MRTKPFQKKNVVGTVVFLLNMMLCTSLFAGDNMQNQEQPSNRPNVIILFIDDLGYGDVGSFGCPDIPTPHIDALATNGVMCTNSYITNPPCCPSRCSLITGMYAQRFGKSGMGRGIPIPEDQPTMGELMRDNGYVTGMIGKWDIGSNEQGPLQRGFMEVARRPKVRDGKPFLCYTENGAEAFLTDLDGDYMVEFVERHATNWKEKPFFLYFSPLAVHSPSRDTPMHYQNRSTATSEKRKALAGAIIAVDDAIGKLSVTLKENGLEENTIILFTGDNGANPNEEGSSKPYRGGKNPGKTIFEGWVHTPAIISWPGHLPKGKTYQGLMCTLDFYATVATVANIPLPEKCDGVNLIPYLKGKKNRDVHKELFWHHVDPTDLPHRNLEAMRWEQWRLVKYKDGWHLFDLKADPKEEQDLSGSYPKIVEKMKKQYDKWTATLPPLIEGKEYKGGGLVPKGYGWATDANKEIF